MVILLQIAAWWVLLYLRMGLHRGIYDGLENKEFSKRLFPGWRAAPACSRSPHEEVLSFVMRFPAACSVDHQHYGAMSPRRVIRATIRCRCGGPWTLLAKRLINAQPVRINLNPAQAEDTRWHRRDQFLA